MKATYKIDHIGLVVASVEEAAIIYSHFFGMSPVTEVIEDPIQQVKLLFLKSFKDELIELIEPASDQSPVSRFVSKGGGLHHLCYQVPDIVDAIDEAKAKGALILSNPVPAVAFQGRRVVFGVLPNGNLFEFVEGMGLK